MESYCTQHDGDCQVETTRQNKMCIRLGDGLHVCSDCLSAAYPDMDSPETGWELAFCDYC